MAILSQSSSNFLVYDVSVGWRLCTQLSIFLLHDLNCVFGALANPFVCHDETFMTVMVFFQQAGNLHQKYDKVDVVPRLVALLELKIAQKILGIDINLFKFFCSLVTK